MLELIVNNTTAKNEPQAADIEVEDYGSVCIVRALTEDGQAWMDETLETEDWQHTLGGVAVDFRMVEGLIDLACDEGFIIGAPTHWRLPHPRRELEV